MEFDSKEDIPENAQVLRLLLQSIPETNQTGPEDFPIGDSLPTLGVGEVADLRFTFNENYEVGGSKVFIAEITVYYTGGQSETYQVQFAGDGS